MGRGGRGLLLWEGSRNTLLGSSPAWLSSSPLSNQPVEGGRGADQSLIITSVTKYRFLLPLTPTHISLSGFMAPTLPQFPNQSHWFPVRFTGSY